MTLLKPILLLADVAQRVNQGRATDVDYFMSYLTKESSTQIIKMVDFAISQIKSRNGIERIKHYLFNGTTIQRNYAALYFKRHNQLGILKKAVLQKCIDHETAFSR
ncbi:MAG: hypothetical protein KQH79_14840 [Bacteroidetes bacterium]|nr:hypothetical protein [Bacteroidota bacterium]